MKHTKHTYAFTAVELLLALAITALLLTAIAVALNASLINYRENEDIFKMVNCSRQALSRITSQLRTANSVAPNTPNNECSLITASGDNITYRYNNSDLKLYLVTNDNLSDKDYILCDNVTNMTFKKNTATENAVVYVKSVQISMTVASGDIQQKISAAAVIRKNLK